MKLYVFSFVLLFAIPSFAAAPMMRVVRIAGPSTIIVEQRGVQSEVRLAGIQVTDPQNAVAFLTWTIGTSWVMVEDGRVYRSPDALFINDELVRKGFAQSTSGVTTAQHNGVYLGELNPAPAAKARESRAKAAPRSPVRPRATRVRAARARRQ